MSDKLVSSHGDGGHSGEKITPRKRSFRKKDRHSKIVTAQGTRDRRMRLSLDIARRFFNLQDNLGFDKASKTVEWLLDKSEGAIHEIMKAGCTVNHQSPSSVSECNAVSENKEGFSGVEKMKMVRTTPCLLGRDAREKARERARRRTVEKKKMLEESSEKISPNCMKASLEALPGTEEHVVSHSLKKHVSLAQFNFQTNLAVHSNNTNLHNIQEHWDARIHSSYCVNRALPGTPQEPITGSVFFTTSDVQMQYTQLAKMSQFYGKLQKP